MFWKYLKYLSDLSDQNGKSRGLSTLSMYQKRKLNCSDLKLKENFGDMGGGKKKGKEGKG